MVSNDSKDDKLKTQDAVADTVEPSHTNDLEFPAQPLPYENGEQPSSFPTREVTDRINLDALEDLRNFRRKSKITSHLVVRRPDYSKVQVPLDREITVIGRAVGCDIVIKDAKSSRKHARVLELSPGTYELEDLNSRNGTWSDGVQVSKMRLMNGDSFSVGNAVFTLRVHHHHDID
jgi:hypothetical protein